MNTKERVQLYQETGFSLDTIARWDKGRNTAESTAKALEAASLKLGFAGRRKCLQEKSTEETAT